MGIELWMAFTVSDVFLIPASQSIYVFEYSVALSNAYMVHTDNWFIVNIFLN